MEKYLNQGIKDVIAQFPQVGEILNNYEIGCTTCMVGTCLLKDVVEIHEIPAEVETQMMKQIEKVIYPERQIEVTINSANSVKAKPITYSPPVETLVAEHRVIKRWLALIPHVIKELSTNEDAWQWVEQGVELIKNYADRYHHAKEEDILFTYVDENSEIIQAMFEEHVMGREHVQSIREAIATKDVNKAAKHLKLYSELLTEHIKKEDELLYPWIERNLSPAQIEELTARCVETDAQAEDPQQYLDFVARLEKVLL